MITYPCLRHLLLAPKSSYIPTLAYTISQAGISNCIPENTMGWKYISLPETSASGTKVLSYSHTSTYDTLPTLESHIWRPSWVIPHSSHVRRGLTREQRLANKESWWMGFTRPQSQIKEKLHKCQWYLGTRSRCRVLCDEMYWRKKITKCLNDI